MDTSHPTGDTPDKQRLREADELSGQSHDYDMPERKLTDSEIRERRIFAQKVENAIIGLDTPARMAFPKDADVLPEDEAPKYEWNGPDDVQIIS